MNRGFNYYFREGVKSSAETLYKNKNLLKFILYFFTELLGRLLIVFNPLFDMANNRQGEWVRKRRQLDISQSFKDADKPYSVWTYVITVMTEALITLAGIAVIAVITFFLGSIGYAVSSFAPKADAELITGAFAVPGILLAAVYLIVMCLIFAPTPYIVCANSGIGVSDTLSACFNTMKAKGKGTVFLNVFVPALIISVYLAVVGFAGYFLFGLLDGTDFLIPAFVLWLIISTVGFFLVAPIFILASRSANQHLFSDIVIDPAAASRAVNGVNIKQCRGQKFGTGEMEKNLVSLFDETDDASALLDEINGAEKPKAAPAKQKDVVLSEAYEQKYSFKKRKPVRADEEESEPLPTVSDVLSSGEPPAEIRDVPLNEAPAHEKRGTDVPVPSIEDIIRQAEAEKAEEQKPQTAEAKTAEPQENKPEPEESEEQKPAEAEEQTEEVKVVQAEDKKPAEEAVRTEQPTEASDDEADFFEDELNEQTQPAPADGSENNGD